MPHGVENIGAVTPAHFPFGKTISTGNRTTIALTFLPANELIPVNWFLPERIERASPRSSRANGSSRGPAKTVMSFDLAIIAGSGVASYVPCVVNPLTVTLLGKTASNDWQGSCGGGQS